MTTHIQHLSANDLEALRLTSGPLIVLTKKILLFISIVQLILKEKMSVCVLPHIC